jgi:hypothetical protein
MWKLPDGKITRARSFTHEGVQYPEQIFSAWTLSELNALGIYPVNETLYNRLWYKSSGVTEEIVDGVLVRTHTVVPRLTIDEAKNQQTEKIKNSYITNINRADDQGNFYDAVGDSNSKKLWSDWATALKNDAKNLKDAVDAAGSYDEIKDLNFQWTPAPDEEVIDGPV